ncbi:hypothetical protein R3W88_015020 [Solanum pinnatisectum]|uniref:HMA domain-containing protein n=1 Tax=Solanum pinnatisectum TaxID=50273 RepID=A0AAV9KXN8_9SOLN|nr:hypothetical protein R3W88_015020 [Solanum pinnatisectum]
MAYSLVSPNTFALKLKIHCKNCEKKLRNMLLKIQGVQSVQIDEKLGNLVISGTVDPTTILTMLEKLGRKAELIWEQGQPINVQTITQSKVINSLNDSDIITRQLEQLSRIPALQTMEVITTIRLTIQGESRNDPSDKVLEIRTTNNLNKPSHPSFDHSQGDGGFCVASSSCCGCHHDATTHKNNCWGKAHPSDSQPPLALTPPSWSSGSSIASAPPLPYDVYHYQTPPPPSSSPIHHTYYNALSDENANGCAIL